MSRIELNDEERVIVSELVEVIHNELQQDKPKKLVLHGILTTLQVIKGTTEF